MPAVLGRPRVGADGDEPTHADWVTDGFSGTATILSRRGQLPRPHAAKGVVPQEIGLPRSKRLSLLTVAVRLACETAEAHGTPCREH